MYTSGRGRGLIVLSLLQNDEQNSPNDGMGAEQPALRTNSNTITTTSRLEKTRRAFKLHLSKRSSNVPLLPPAKYEDSPGLAGSHDKPL